MCENKARLLLHCSFCHGNILSLYLWLSASVLPILLGYHLTKSLMQTFLWKQLFISKGGPGGGGYHIYIYIYTFKNSTCLICHIKIPVNKRPNWSCDWKFQVHLRAVLFATLWMQLIGSFASIPSRWRFVGIGEPPWNQTMKGTNLIAMMRIIIRMYMRMTWWWWWWWWWIMVMILIMMLM